MFVYLNVLRYDAGTEAAGPAGIPSAVSSLCFESSSRLFSITNSIRSRGNSSEPCAFSILIINFFVVCFRSTATMARKKISNSFIGSVPAEIAVAYQQRSAADKWSCWATQAFISLFTGWKRRLSIFEFICTKMV